AEHWEQDLTQLPGLAAQVTRQVQTIVEHGMRSAVADYC
ncbi:altronate oxidoreductase, partial [Escherichia coli]